MMSEEDLNLLITNIVEQKQFSHCRLCLKNIKNDENFARLDDIVSQADTTDFLKLSYVLSMLFGSEICDEIPGINAVCDVCVDHAIISYEFRLKYNQATSTIHKVLDDLNTKLDLKIEAGSNLYIVCNETDSQVLLVKNNEHDVVIDCDQCRTSFNNITHYCQHNLTEHDTYTCKKCFHTTSELQKLDKHKASLQIYKCSECNKTRCTEESLKDHKDNAHSLHVCKECGKSLKGYQRLLQHEQKHKIRNECPKCGKNYTTREFFNKHVKLCLEGLVDPHPMRSRMQKSYSCKECGKGYSTPGGLRVHERFTHGDAKPHVCKECGKKFTAPSYLKAHMITHLGVKNYPCKLCGGRFVTKEALLYHTRRHTGDKPYSCNLCNEKFVNSSSRADHIKLKHIGPTLPCELCPRKFVTKNFLRLHMKKHHDPSNKIYIGRNAIPPNIPGEQNMRVKIA